MLSGFVFFVVIEVAFRDASEQEKIVVDTISEIINAFIVLDLACFFNILKMRTRLLKRIILRQFLYC